MPFVIHFVADNPENLNEMERTLTDLINEVEGTQVVPVSKLQLSESSILGADTVFVSPFVDAQLVAAPLLGASTPIINASRSMAMHLGYAQANSALHKIDVQISDVNHPLSGDLSGDVNIYNPEDDFGYLVGTPGSVKTIVSYQGNPVIVNVASDSNLLDGKKNSSEIIGLHIFQGEIPGNAQWNQLIDAAVNYAVSLSRRLPSGWSFAKIGAHGAYESFARLMSR